jgi:hypothetical protein
VIKRYQEEFPVIFVVSIQKFWYSYDTDSSWKHFYIMSDPFVCKNTNICFNILYIDIYSFIITFDYSHQFIIKTFYIEVTLFVRNMNAHNSLDFESSYYRSPDTFYFIIKSLPVPHQDWVKVGCIRLSFLLDTTNLKKKSECVIIYVDPMCVTMIRNDFV